MFYEVTNIGQDIVGHRLLLHVEFCRKYAQLQVTEQRLNIIKTEVEREIQNQQ